MSTPMASRPPWSGRRPRRAHWSGSGDAATETVWFEIKDKFGATDFLGYDTRPPKGVIQALVRDGARWIQPSWREVDVVVNQTPFYGESGGQMGDQGTISGEGYRLEVSDTQKRGEGLFVHRGGCRGRGESRRRGAA
jgi:alanyl-tRNA synthetase